MRGILRAFFVLLFQSFEIKSGLIFTYTLQQQDIYVQTVIFLLPFFSIYSMLEIRDIERRGYTKNAWMK